MNYLYRKAILYALLLLFLLASCSSVDKYIQADEVKEWEQDIELFDSMNAVEPAGPNTLLVTGSSSVRLWNTIHEDMAPYQVMQRGYGGAKLTDFNYYTTRIIQAGSMKAVVIYVSNDISGDGNDRTPREVFQLYKKVVHTIRERNPDTPVFWIEFNPAPTRWHVIDQIDKANTLIRKYCNRNEDLFFIGTRDILTTASGMPDSTLFKDDMLHLNRQGYERWAERIKLNLEEDGILP